MLPLLNVCPGKGTMCWLCRTSSFAVNALFFQILYNFFSISSYHFIRITHKTRCCLYITLPCSFLENALGSGKMLLHGRKPLALGSSVGGGVLFSLSREHWFRKRLTGVKGGVGTWKVIPRGECAQEPSRAQALRREENMAATSAHVEMGEAAVFTWNSFWGQPGWSVWKCGRLLLSLGNTVGRKIDTECRVETVTKLRVVCF